MATPLNIVVVEDHDALRDVTVAALQEMGHVVRGASCGESLNDELGGFRADLLVLDLNLPGEDGISIARRIRGAQPEIGIIMVTARNQVRDITHGYGSGADIYLTKPTSPEELAAAVAALSRRLRPAQSKAGSLQLNPATLQLSGALASVNVSDTEYLLLMALTKAPDHRLETWQLLELSGKSGDEQEKRALAVQIVRLRKKLNDAGAPEPTLKAIRGSGYQLCVRLEITHLPG